MLHWLQGLFSTFLNGRQITFKTYFRYSGYMKLALKRLDATDHGLYGHLSTDGFDCVTLERHDIFIPCGTYKISLYKSPEHGIVPLIEGVPGRSMIEIHEGNFEHNSKGCVL